MKKENKGFTLIELLVVISIIAVLSTIGLVVYQDIQAKARDSIRKNDLNNLATALELYNQTNHKYFIGNTIAFYADDSPMMNLMNNTMPLDPKDNSSQYYYNSDDGSTFFLCANLENDSDPDRSDCPNSDYDYLVVPK